MVGEVRGGPGAVLGAENLAAWSWAVDGVRSDGRAGAYRLPLIRLAVFLGAERSQAVCMRSRVSGVLPDFSLTRLLRAWRVTPMVSGMRQSSRTMRPEWRELLP